MGLKREVVRGEPIKMGDREIVPEAVIWSWRRSDATLSQNNQAMLWGGLFVGRDLPPCSIGRPIGRIAFR